ncbi:MAG: SUMF1/EgtB/PvdO family nonheme iron enzyme [Lacunisphaera sp.]|nr:SUMF1/EgtB/PvdO family nonheme iron enzyme [Lacunisphaera sp.]
MNFDKEPELPDTPPVSTRPRWLLGLLAVVGLGAAAFFAYWQFAAPPAAPLALTAEQKKILGEIAYLEGRLDIIAADLARLDPKSPPAARRQLLEEALERQNRLRRLRPVPLAADELRLAEWQTKLGDTYAREWNLQSEELEAESALLQKQKQPGVVEKLKEALRLQREVNGGLADQALKNYGREARLEQDAERLDAEPLRAEGARVLAEARASVAAGRWTAALELYGRARDIQLKLNHEYARTRFADLLAVDRLDAEMASLSATEAHDQLEALVTQATAAATAQKLDEADRLLAEAVARQKLINEQFAQSRFVSMERLEQLEADRQTLRARAVLTEVRELDHTAAGHLRRRELFQSQQLLGLALEKLASAVVQLPKARGIDEELRQRLSYLNLRSADLVPIQDQTYDLLMPLPGREQFALLKTEVPQALYVRVMNGNPSRNPGPTLPVDSVTYAEAGEFCRRLGWVLGATVRLPAAAEFRAAVGDGFATAANAWGLENGPGKSQPAGEKPANALGFHDLLGNVAEWLAADAGDTAVLAGGSFTESRGQLQALPLRRAAKTERARTNGFRVVVEFDLAAGR